MNDIKPDPSFSYETSPDLYLFTSLTAGSSHIITATSRMETILKANRIPFKAVDCATDEKARRIWGRRAAGKKLPGLVKEGQVLGDLEAVEEWNEFGEIKQVLGSEAAPKPAPAAGNTAVPAAAPVSSTTAEKEEAVPLPSETESSKGPEPEAIPSAPADNTPNPSTATGEDLPVRTKDTAPTKEQLIAQLGTEAAAVAALHSKKGLKSILDRDPKRKNSADLLSDANGTNDKGTFAADEGTTADSKEPTVNAPTISFAEPPKDGPTSTSDAATTIEPLSTYASAAEAIPTDTAPASAPPSTEPTTTSPPMPKPIEEPNTSSSPPTTSTTISGTSASIEPVPILPDPARAPRASVTAGDLAVSTSPPQASITLHTDPLSASESSETHKTPPPPPVSSSSAAAPDPQLASRDAGSYSDESAVVFSPTSSVSIAAPAVTHISHRGSSISVATDEEVRDAEERNRIVEEDEGEDGGACV